MEGLLELFIILVLVAVVPLWLILHYVTIWRRGQLARPSAGRNRDDEAEPEDLESISVRLEERLEAIETILDADAPGWRDKK